MTDTNLITPKVTTGWVSLAAFAGDVSRHAEITLSETSLPFSLVPVIIRKFFKISTIKQDELLDAIKLLYQSKLDKIANIVSQAVPDGDISSI